MKTRPQQRQQHPHRKDILSRNDLSINLLPLKDMATLHMANGNSRRQSAYSSFRPVNLEKFQLLIACLHRPPKRDWRDWFIMATVMGGVGYGLYSVAKVFWILII